MCIPRRYMKPLGEERLVIKAPTIPREHNPCNCYPKAFSSILVHAQSPKSGYGNRFNAPMYARELLAFGLRGREVPKKLWRRSQRDAIKSWLQCDIGQERRETCIRHPTCMFQPVCWLLHARTTFLVLPEGMDHPMCVFFELF